LVTEANRLRLIGDNVPAATLLDQAVALAPDASDVHLAAPPSISIWATPTKPARKRCKPRNWPLTAA
jgi:hypothetical protein